jgi:hypothetical protein
VANYNFLPENRRFWSLAPDGVLPYASPQMASPLSRAIRASPRGVINNSPCTRSDSSVISVRTRFLGSTVISNSPCTGGRRIVGVYSSCRWQRN